MTMKVMIWQEQDGMRVRSGDTRMRLTEWSIGSWFIQKECISKRAIGDFKRGEWQQISSEFCDELRSCRRSATQLAAVRSMIVYIPAAINLTQKAMQTDAVKPSADPHDCRTWHCYTKLLLCDSPGRQTDRQHLQCSRHSTVLKNNEWKEPAGLVCNDDGKRHGGCTLIP